MPENTTQTRTGETRLRLRVVRDANEHTDRKEAPLSREHALRLTRRSSVALMKPTGSAHAPTTPDARRPFLTVPHRRRVAGAPFSGRETFREKKGRTVPENNELNAPVAMTEKPFVVRGSTE